METVMQSVATINSVSH